MIIRSLVFGVFSLLVMMGCSNDDETPIAGPVALGFGEVTSAVVIVNPIINEGSSTTVTSGVVRQGVSIKPGDMDDVTTDVTGLSVIMGLPTGTVPLQFNVGSVDVNVIQDKELYDVIVSYKDNVTEIIEEVRYPIGGAVLKIAPGQDLAGPFNTDNAIIVLEEGIYEGDYNIPAEGVLIFGAWDQTEGPKSVFTGNITVSGGGVRMRGIQNDGVLTVNANLYSAAFCVLHDADIKGNEVSLIRNIFNGTQVTVPSSSAVLLDNTF